MKKTMMTIMIGLALAGGVQAASYPEKPVTMIVPFAPGGSTDILARAMAQRMLRFPPAPRR